MDFRNRTAEILKLRDLAHQLRLELIASETNGCLQLPPHLHTDKVWAEQATTHLRAHSQRHGIGRLYIEEIDLETDGREVRMKLSRRVRTADQEYHAGTWCFREDLNSGRFRCCFELKPARAA